MSSYLLQSIPEKLAALAVEGTHKPGSLTQASGAWIHAAGAFVLEKGLISQEFKSLLIIMLRLLKTISKYY